MWGRKCGEGKMEGEVERDVEGAVGRERWGERGGEGKWRLTSTSPTLTCTQSQGSGYRSVLSVRAPEQ